MPYELFLALRYVLAGRGRRVARWTALAAVVGIAFGVAALVFALALANGFRDELRDKILAGTAHVTVTRAGGATVAELRGAAARARAVRGVADASATAYEGALLSGPGGAAFAVLRGLDRDSARAVERAGETLVSGSLGQLFGDRPVDEQTPAHIFVGEGLAARTGLAGAGAEGWVVTGEAARGGEGFVPRARRVRVAGVFSTGLHDYDSAWAYLPLEEAARLGGGSLRSPAVSVEVSDIYAAGEAARRVGAELGAGWAAVDWREANRPLFAALELERRTVSLIILLIMVLAALNITTTLALVVTERRADIAVLRALGARGRGVVTIFVTEGAILGAAGALAGAALGLAACLLADRFGLVRLPPDVYSISFVPLRPSAAGVLLPALAAFCVSLLATLYPASRAARVRPAEALRYE